MAKHSTIGRRERRKWNRGVLYRNISSPDLSFDNADITLLPDDLFICTINTALQNLSHGSPLFLWLSLTDWHFVDSHFYFKNHLYIPSPVWHDLVSSVHSSLASGHGGFFCTHSLLTHNYWWLRMSSFVRHFVMDCTLCQQMKVNTHPMTPPLSPLSSSCTCPFQQLSVDLVTSLLLSHGFDSLLAVVNHSLLKGVILTPCNKTIDDKRVAELFFKHVFLHFRLHDHLISDQRPHFTSAFATELAQILRYDLKLSTAYHPQTDGETEWINQEVEMYLWMFCQGQPDKWSEFIPMAKFTHNSATHSSTQKSPFSLILGYELRDYLKFR